MYEIVIVPTHEIKDKHNKLIEMGYETGDFVDDFMQYKRKAFTITQNKNNKNEFKYYECPFYNLKINENEEIVKDVELIEEIYKKSKMVAPIFVKL